MLLSALSAIKYYQISTKFFLFIERFLSLFSSRVEWRLRWVSLATNFLLQINDVLLAKPNVKNSHIVNLPESFKTMDRVQFKGCQMFFLVQYWWILSFEMNFLDRFFMFIWLTLGFLQFQTKRLQWPNGVGWSQTQCTFSHWHRYRSTQVKCIIIYAEVVTFEAV